MTRTTKKFFIRLSASFLIVVLFVSLLVGCSLSSKKESPTLRIGVAVYLQDDTFIGTLVQDLERLAQKWESAENLKINLNIMIR